MKEPDNNKETILWALSKLEDELSFFVGLDYMKYGRFEKDSNERIVEIKHLRDSIMNGDITISTKKKRKATHA